MKKSDLKNLTSDEKMMIKLAAEMVEIEKSKKSFSGDINELKAEKVMHKKGGK